MRLAPIIGVVAALCFFEQATPNKHYHWHKKHPDPPQSDDKTQSAGTAMPASPTSDVRGKVFDKFTQIRHVG